MATNFPTSLDSLTNPAAGNSLNSPSHAGQHADANDAIEALEAKVGVNSSAVTTSLDYKVTQLETNGVTLTGTQTLTNKTLTSPTINTGIFRSPEERWNVVASAATGTINIDVLTSTNWHYTSVPTANHILNVRGDSTTTLNSLLAVGDSITVVWAILNGPIAYYPNAFTIDGTAHTIRWQGGTAPTSGNASAFDVYVYTILKVASTPTYRIFASQTKFA